MSPLDKKGSYHMNPAVARMHSSKGEVSAPEIPDPGEQEENNHDSVHHIELHPHGDGTHHSITHMQEDHPEHTLEGTRTDHPDLEHFQQHVSEKVGEQASEYDDAGEEAGEASDVDDEY